MCWDIGICLPSSVLVLQSLLVPKILFQLDGAEQLNLETWIFLQCMHTSRMEIFNSNTWLNSESQSSAYLTVIEGKGGITSLAIDQRAKIINQQLLGWRHGWIQDRPLLQNHDNNINLVRRFPLILQLMH